MAAQPGQAGQTGQTQGMADLAFPCGACGGTPWLEINGPIGAGVHCPCGQGVTHYTLSGDALAGAIDAWNRNYSDRSRS